MKYVMRIMLAVFILSLPAAGYGADCAEADGKIKKIHNDELQLLDLANEYQTCGRVYVALGEYYRKRGVWKAAYNHYAKALDFYPASAKLKTRLSEVKKKIPLSIASDEEFKAASVEIKARAIAGVRKLRPVALRILFDFGSAEIRPENRQLIEKFAEMIKSTGGKYRFDVQGHTDNVGTYEFNKDLSIQRAAAVKDYLVERYGVDSQRLKVEGYAFEDPIDTNVTEEGRSNNRRVQFEGHWIEH